MAGKCPKCDGLVTQAIVDLVNLKVIEGETFRGASYSCPNCGVVLSIQMDPNALEVDIVKAVAALLRKG